MPGMQVQAFRSPLVHAGDDFWEILRSSVDQIPDQSVLVVTSKVLSLCEGRVVAREEADKFDLVRREADMYTEPHSSRYGLMLTVTHDQLAVNAGIDESNSNGQYVLWPADSQQWANDIWSFVRQEYGVKEVGVIVSDSRTQPLYWGVIGASLAHCGFRALNPLIGKPDLFGREMRMTQVSVVQALAATAVFEMGEGAEQTPFAIVSDIRDIAWQHRPPTESELADLRIELEDDVYAPILTKAEWKTAR